VKKASLNLIDKAIAFVNPQGAVDRLVARQKIKNFEYDAVKYSRERKGPSSLSGAEDYRSNYDRVELMKRARDLAENVGLVRSILMKFASHTAANISYQARTENPEVNSEVEAYWAEWWDKCDISTRHTGSTLMQVAMMSMLRDGDFLFVLVRDSDGNLKIQGIEGDRLGDPYKVYTSSELIGGIHIDQRTGAPTAYDIYSRTIGDMYSYQATIPSSQAFHLFDPLRIDQYRGISAFHTAINDATDIHEIVSFEKMAAKYASSQAGIIKRNNNNASDLSSLTNDQDINGSIIKLEAIESGKISYLEPGEDIVFPDGPSRPSGAFAEFHKILLRNICLGLGIPYSFAVDPSAMSGPTARLEMQQAGRTFRRYQKLLDDKVLRPIKNIVIADGVARGLIEKNVGSRTTRGIFNFGANVSIDLGRESASAISEFKTGLRTAADIYAERGQDFESAMRQRAIEAKLVKDLAGEYEVSADTISDIAAEGLTRDSQKAQATPAEGDQKPAGQPSDEDMLGGASLNGAQVASLINVINAVAMGAVSKEGAVSIITAAFPTISPDQARAIIAGVNVGTTIPTTKEEKQQIAKDQEGDSSGGSTPPAPEPTTPPTAPAGTSQKKSSLEVLESLDPASIKMLIEGMMGGIELAKYEGINFSPPQGARDAAKRALDVREGKPASQRGMTPVGIARARDLMNGVKLSPDTARRMKAFFDRHEVDKKGSTWDEQGKGWQAWNGWGGDAGYAWARKVVGQMEARDKKTEFVAGRDCGQDEGGTFGPDNKCAVGYGRPPIKGGYTPTRPGGKFPKDYKRPTPQDKGSGTTEPKQQAEAEKAKDKSSLDSYKYDKNGEARISITEHEKAIENAYEANTSYEDEKKNLTTEEKQSVDDYRKSSGGIWSKYERANSEGMTKEQAFQEAINSSPGTLGQRLQSATGGALSDKDMATIALYDQTGNIEGLKQMIQKAQTIADNKIEILNNVSSQKFSKEQTFYRGFTANGVDSAEILDKVKNEGKVDFTSFMSASSDPSIASNYARRSEEDQFRGESILFRIKAKKGVSTINSNNQEFESELQEIILPKGEYKVTNRRTVKTGKAKTYFVDLEQV
jgi:lambda family phage portal protein